MSLLGDLAAYVDSLKRTAGNSLRDLRDDPQGLLSMRAAQLAESLPALPQSVMPGVDSAGLGPMRPTAQDWSIGAAMNAPTMGLLGHTVYHGSPHKFDKFDASKIGTGEGAQAYGHGLYLAESPTVAAGYKETLSARVKDRLTIDGKVVDPDSMLGRAAEDVPRIGLQATLQKIDDNIKFNEKYAPDMAEMYRGIREKIASLDPSRVSVKEGALYKVDLPDEWLPKMLDWDKPLSEQPEGVKAALRKSPFAPDESVWPHYTGRQLYEGEMNARGPYKADGWPTAAAATDVSGLLNKQGIPGIRYKDQGSRGKEGGTYNYVVFPGMEHLLKILERE